MMSDCMGTMVSDGGGKRIRKEQFSQFTLAKRDHGRLFVVSSTVLEEGFESLTFVLSWLSLCI